MLTTLMFPLLAMLQSALAQPDELSYGLSFTFTPDERPCQTITNASDSGVSFHVDFAQNAGNGLCINLDNLFTEKTAMQMGSLNNSAAIASLTQGLQQNPHGAPVYAPASLNWTSYNGQHYDPNANYTNVWYYQVNQTGSDFGAGAYGKFKVSLSSVVDCALGFPPLSYDYTCQTNFGGQCNKDTTGVKSISILPINQSTDSCYTFQKYPSSGLKAEVGTTVIAAALIILVTAFSVL